MARTRDAASRDDGRRMYPDSDQSDALSSFTLKAASAIPVSFSRLSMWSGLSSAMETAAQPAFAVAQARQMEAEYARARSCANKINLFNFRASHESVRNSTKFKSEIQFVSHFELMSQNDS